MRWLRPCLLLLMVFTSACTSSTLTLEPPGGGTETSRYRKAATADRTRIGAIGDPEFLDDFPALLRLLDPDLRSVVNGGHVALAGADIFFEGIDAETCNGPPPCVLDHELERYVAATGELLAWVRVPRLRTVASTSDTTIYLSYGGDAAAQNAEGVWRSDFRAVYHLDEDPTGGAVILDSTLNSNTANSNGGMTAADLVAGTVGNGLRFDGVDDGVLGTYDASLHVLGDLTVSGWVNANSFGISPALASFGAFGNTPETNVVYELYLEAANGRLAVFWEYGAGLDLDLLDTGIAPGLSDWHHVAAVRDTADSECRFYVDGALSGAQPYVTNPDGGESGLLHLGRANSGFYLDGTLDEFRVVGAALSGGEIRTDFENQSLPALFFTIGAEEPL